MKKLVLLFLSLSGYFVNAQTGNSLILDGSLDNDPIKVQLINRTGYQIDTLIFHNRLFPVLENNDSTKTFQIGNYVEGDFVRGTIIGVSIDNANWVWHCLGRPHNSYPTKILKLEIILIPSPFIKGESRLITKISE